MLGPGFETFVGALMILLLAVIPLVWFFRKPVVRLYNHLCEEDRKEMAEVRAREQSCKEEQEAEQAARQKALDEVDRDCYGQSSDVTKNDDVQQAAVSADRTNEKREI